MGIPVSVLRKAAELLTTLDSLEDLHKVTQQTDLPNVQFPMDLMNGISYDLTLPRDEFLFILDRNIESLTNEIVALGFQFIEGS